MQLASLSWTQVSFAQHRCHVLQKWEARFTYTAQPRPIIDTVFVCRKSGTTRRTWLFDTPDRLVEIVSQDLTDLAASGRRPSLGDTRCIVFGHLTRIAVWKFRETWKRSNSTKEKIALFRAGMRSYGDPDQLARRATTSEAMEDLPLLAQKTNKIREEAPDVVSF